MKVFLAFFLVLLLPLHAAEWRNDAFGCSVNLPEGAEWEAIPAPAVQGITVLVAMQNQKRQANFIVNVIDNTPSTDLNDVKVQQMLGGMLRAFTYEFYGFSKVQVGGITWLQYPVTSRSGGVVTKGIVRFGSGNGHIFSVSMMLGGGKEPAQDVELQTMAASFRFVTPGTPQPAAVAATTPGKPAGPRTSETKPGVPAEPARETVEEPEKTVLGGVPISYVRYAVFGACGLLILILLIKIIGGPGTPKDPRAR